MGIKQTSDTQAHNSQAYANERNSKASLGSNIGAPTSADIAQRKRELRRDLKRLRAELGSDARSAADEGIANRLFALEEFQQAGIVLTYLAMGAEVETRQIIRRAWDLGKTVALPRCVKGTRLMEWFCVDNLDGLEKSSFGVEEPPRNPQRMLNPLGEVGKSAVALVPALAFDLSGYRLGYGGGFYDTFLAGFTGASVGLCREEQLVDDLSVWGVLDAHDLPTNVVVSQARTLRG